MHRVNHWDETSNKPLTSRINLLTGNEGPMILTMYNSSGLPRGALWVDIMPCHRLLSAKNKERLGHVCLWRRLDSLEVRQTNDFLGIPSFLLDTGQEKVLINFW